MTKKNPSYIESVIDVVRLIPTGRVTNYGAIADFLALGSARMVGWALNKSGINDPSIPAHRVLNRKGQLTGRLAFKDPDYMERTLLKEGIPVKDNQVQNFETYYWHPEEILSE